MLIRSSSGRPCRICRTPACACGGPTTNTVFPINTTLEAPVVERQPVYEYDVKVNGYTTIMNLTAADAERLHPGAKRRTGPVAVDHPEHSSADQPGVAAPVAKARTAPNK